MKLISMHGLEGLSVAFLSRSLRQCLWPRSLCSVSLPQLSSGWPGPARFRA